MDAMTRQCPRAGKHTVLGHLFLHPHHSSVQLPGDWELLPVVVAEVRAVSLGPELAGAHAVWLSPAKASGLPSHPPTLSKYFCLYESEEAELHFGVGANS